MVGVWPRALTTSATSAPNRTASPTPSSTFCLVDQPLLELGAACTDSGCGGLGDRDKRQACIRAGEHWMDSGQQAKAACV